jgi:hypothetical protein
MALENQRLPPDYRPRWCQEWVHPFSTGSGGLSPAFQLVITQIFSKDISVNLIINCQIPRESIDSSACPLDVRPPFSPPASWLKPRQGWPVYSAGAPTPSCFLFFSGASLARRSNCPPAAPLKNKKTAVDLGSLFKQVTPTGFLALDARWRWSTSTQSRRCPSISSS